MKKRVLAFILAMTCLFVAGVYASAGDTDFDITVSRDGAASPDPNSYREIKDDNEQKYYVRCTYMNHSPARITFQSCSVDGEIRSDWGTYRSSEMNTTKSYFYDGYAPGGEYYYLHGIHASHDTATYTYLNVVGWYCP